ncbi:MAG: hypothetical protein GH155_00380 [Spirochaeta sp.]|nr:hypothetical protein [Spirochaeta sp.]
MTHIISGVLNSIIKFTLTPQQLTAIHLTVDFLGLEPASEPFAAADDSTTAPAVSFSIELRRWIAENRLGLDVDYYKPFSFFEENDSDISSEIWDAIYGGEDVTIALYALSYGKRDLIIDVYSIAVYLFEIDIKLPH